MSNSKPVYDLEERTFQYAKRVRIYVKKLPKTTANIEDGKQVIRASGSVSANYIEANESLSKKDFLMRVKICRKEAKEFGRLRSRRGTATVAEAVHILCD
jgi:four helix bundle protein